MTAGILKPAQHELPPNWRVERLGSVSSVTGGGRLGLTKERDYRAAGFPAYSAAGQDGFVDRWEFERVAVVIPSIGSIGRAYRAEGRWSTLANTQVIFPRPELLDHRFLQLRVDDTDFWPVSGTAQPFIKPSDIPKCWIALPPLPEQQRIAEILDSLDEAIRKTDRLIAKLKQVKQGLLHDLLTRGIDGNGELRDPGRHPHDFKDSQLGRLPKTWSVQPLNELVDPARPIVYGILMPGTGHPNGIPVIKVKDIVGGRVRQDGLLLTSPALDYEYRRSRVKEGDLLFTIRGTVGRMAIVPSQLENANITQDTARLAVKGASVSFVRQYLAMPEPQRFIGVHTLGVAVQGINLRDVRRIPIATPPRTEADEIARRLDCCDARASAEQDEAEKLRVLKRGLTEDLLTGRVRVTDLQARRGG